MENTSFVHLHLHSQYSLLDGAIKFDPLVNRCKELGMPAVALTDHGNMFGAVEFYKKAKQADIKPILGCEMYVASGSRFEKRGTDSGAEGTGHLVLLCQNLTGYKNLCRLVTMAYKEGFYYKPRVDWSLLEECNEGLIALTACLGGEVPTLLKQRKEEHALKRAQEMAQIFDQGRLYLELQENYIPEQALANEGLLKIHQQTGIPLVATNDCHYLTKDDAHAHEVLLCIQTGKTMDDPKRFRFPNEEFYLKTPAEMQALFSKYPGAVENTVKIAQCCDVELDFDTYHFPQYEKPADKSLDEVLEEDSRRGLDQRLAELRLIREIDGELEQAYRERLEVELETIRSMGFPGYFLIVADFINWAKDHNVPVGPGRGSAAGSLVAFSIRITDIDPMPYNLLFERFLNPERISMPDIDVDFCIYGREKVIDYVRQKYGEECVAQIITFGTMAAKGVIRDVGRALSMPYGEVDKIAKLVPGVLNITLKQALQQEPKLQEMVNKDAQIKELMTVSLALEGLCRHASTHAAGVVVTPKPLYEYLPLYADPKTGAMATQYPMSYAEAIGLVKFDFLGLKTLTVIDKAVALIHASGKTDFDLNLVRDDDQKTYQLLQVGETTGVFQLESSGMKELLVKLKPSCFEDIIAVCALYRPGPLNSGMVDDFILRKHGKKAITYAFPQLEPILNDTYGVIVYQEQVMQIAQVLGNYSLGGADLLRRAMGKKKVEEMEKQKAIFLAGAKDNQLDLKKAEGVFDLMAMFAEYGFNKSHSAAYALIAYQTAYLKAHHPVEFMAALLTEDMENTDKVIKNINEVRTMGIEVEPPDINASDRTFTVDSTSIRFGLGAVKGVGSAALESILAVRKADGPYRSLHDFCERVDLRKVNKKVLEALIKCGAFDSLGGKRAAYMEAMDSAMEVAARLQREKELGQESLFASEAISSAAGSGYGELPDTEEWDDKVRLNFEKEALGFYITGHPLSRHMEAIKCYATCSLAELSDRKDKEHVQVCGLIAGKKELMTKKGDRMAFLTVEDLTGFVEVVAFPEVYATAAELLTEDDPLIVSGELDVGEETTKLLASEINLLTDVRKKATGKVRFCLEADKLDEQRLRQLKQLVQRYRGKCPVHIQLTVPDHSTTLISLPDRLKVAPTDEMIGAVEKLFGYNVVILE